MRKKGCERHATEKIKECPRCRDIPYGETEIATPISLSSTSPLAVLTGELYRSLPISPKPEIAKKPGGGRKLLGFYDSRQGAARFAAFLQDAINSQTYRHIIPVAIGEYSEEEGGAPDFDDLVEYCFDLAIDNRIFHTDPSFSQDLNNVRDFSGPQKRRLKNRIKAEILAEITTRRRRRQSLESLGLLSIEYDLPNCSELAETINLSSEKTQVMIKYLLDGLRNSKLIELPKGVDRDDEVFGRNKFSPRIVRSNPQKYEQAWVGATERQHRRIIVKQILTSQNLDASEENQETVLNEIFTWLLGKTDLLSGDASDGYRLNFRRIFFTNDAVWYKCDQCQRISSRGGVGLPCQHPRCEGTSVPILIDSFLEENRYHTVFTRDLIPMRVEEHTAQLDRKKASDYQKGFKSGDINVLSCSTTFEMGIDLGDLQSVVLNNIPPTVANYRQRSGRAGRRTNGTAFILAWATGRPHDQTYFTSPQEIISGYVRVPHLALENVYIQQRHVNAVLFSAYMRYRYAGGFTDLGTVGPFFDSQVVVEPHCDGINEWLISREEEIQQSLGNFARELNVPDEQIHVWTDSFKRTLLQKETDHYNEVSSFYIEEIERINQQIGSSGTSNVENLTNEGARTRKLLERLRKKPLINYLSDRGVLPSYSFPLHTVELMIPPD